VRDPALQQFLDQRFNRRVAPEMRKAFQTGVTQREHYRIARYDSTAGGVLHPHRDNSRRNRNRRFTDINPCRRFAAPRNMATISTRSSAAPRRLVGTPAQVMRPGPRSLGVCMGVSEDRHCLYTATPAKEFGVELWGRARSTESAIEIYYDPKYSRIRRDVSRTN
jgi:hypothetical protein